MEDMLLSEFPPIKDLRRDSLTCSPVDTTSISEIAKKVLAKKAEKYKKLYPNLSPGKFTASSFN